MADASWDNAGEMEPRKGMPLWAKILLGCLSGCALLVVILGLSCFGLVKWVEKDPKGFENKVKGWVQNMAEDDWQRLREVGNKLLSVEGTKELYKAHPDLKDSYGSEEAFLKAAAQWRPHLLPIPERIPDLDSHNLTYNRMMRRTTIGFTNAKGARFLCTFEKERLISVTVSQREAPEPEPEPAAKEE